MNTYEMLLDFYKNNGKRIERIVLPSGYIEYRIWSLSSISYNGKVKSCGKTYKMKLLHSQMSLISLKKNICEKISMLLFMKNRKNFTPRILIFMSLSQVLIQNLLLGYPVLSFMIK